MSKSITDPTLRMNAASFALSGLAATRACGVFFNPYKDMSAHLNPSQNGMLEKFVQVCFELGMLPDLRPGWEYPNALKRVLEMYKCEPKDLEEFIQAFREALQMMLGKDEFLGDSWEGQRTAEDERKDVLAFVSAEASKFEQALLDEERDPLPKGTRKEKRARLSAKASILGTMHAYLARGDHQGAAGR